MVIGYYSKVLMINRDNLSEDQKHPDRLLTVFPGYNEAEDVEKNIDTLHEMIHRVKLMRKEITNISNNALHKVEYIKSKMQSARESDAYDGLLGNLFFRKLNMMKSKE